MKKIFLFVKLLIGIAFIFSLTSCEEMINAMLDSSRPTLTMSQGTHTNYIDVSWTAPSKENITILSYNIRYDTSDFLTGSGKNVGFATSYAISMAANATLYYAEVQAIYRDNLTNQEITGDWSMTANGFAMDSIKLTWTSTATAWNLSSTETWFTTMLQKGYSYTFIGIQSNTVIEVYKEGDISLPPLQTLTTTGTALTWKCNVTGNSGKFYFKVKRGSVTSMYVSFSAD